MKNFMETCEALDYLAWESEFELSLRRESLGLVIVKCSSQAESVWDLAYSFYFKAMARKREPLEEGRFIGHFFEGRSLQETFMYGSESHGWLMGTLMPLSIQESRVCIKENLNTSIEGMQDGVFMVSHFAPRSLRTGVVLLETAAFEDTPIGMAVTSDLAAMLSRMDGWNLLPMNLPREFRGEIVMKSIYVNDSLLKSGKLLNTAY